MATEARLPSSGAPAQGPLAPGAVLGHYKVLRHIGTGGMGHIHAAEDLNLQREVALKVATRADGRTLDEARALAALNHPNVVTIYELESHEGSAYIVMELLRGGTLREVLAARRPTVDEVRAWAADALAGLEAAHAVGVLHLDLKPDNLFVTQSGALKLLDFGVARRWRPGDDPGEGTMAGTLPYMAPEMILGRPVDARVHHLCVVTPCLVPDAMIPSDFDWHTYHAFTIAEPGVNPARETRWSPPNVDYGGQGLISCVSAPVYEGDAFLGVWTMDVRLADLHADLALETLGRIGERQTNFLVDYDGRLLAHPALDPEAQGEKGAVYNVRLASLGGDYEALDLAGLIARGHGQTEVVDAAGVRHLLAFRAVPEIRWVVFASFPSADLVEATQAAFQQAFAHLGEGDLTARLDAVGDETMQRLAGSFNEMTATLQESLRRREQAEAERRRLAAEQERMARELEIAASIQLAMLPRAPAHPAFEFAGLMQPAEEVGGDVYDVITRGDGLWITVGDVSSHGLGSGLVMMLAQMAFRTVFEAAPGLPADEAVRRVNRLVHANATLGGARYITAQLVAWRGGATFDLAGGHLWPLVIDTASRAVRRVEAPGPWLGIVPELPVVPVTRVELHDSEVLCLYSDGIIEARDASGAMFDLERLGARLVALLGDGGDLAACAAGVLADVAAFSAELDDDRTLLLVRPRGGGGSVSP